MYVSAFQDTQTLECFFVEISSVFELKSIIDFLPHSHYVLLFVCLVDPKAST